MRMPETEPKEIDRHHQIEYLFLFFSCLFSFKFFLSSLSLPPPSDSSASRYLESLSPSSIDAELSTLATHGAGGLGQEQLGLFLDFLIDRLKTRSHFELIQAYLHRFLQLHSSALLALPALLPKLMSLRALQASSWSSLEQSLQQNQCLLAFFSQLQ